MSTYCFKVNEAYTVEAFLWTAGPDQVEDPKWFNEAVERGDLTILNKGSRYVNFKATGNLLSHYAPCYVVKNPGGSITGCNKDLFESVYREIK